ncbi:MAG: RNA 2',3'-cyclic phosphodiesterase, partial [Eubacterium sp.]|nr:RNA 2',3'-cyclic phosphodiesterase [Eubacterium sp.]
MRLFICIEFDNKIIGSLKTVQGELKKAGLKGRFTSEENLHLTLAFIGEYNDPDYVLDAMEVSEFNPFPIEIEGIGNFDDLYWAGLK